MNRYVAGTTVIVAGLVALVASGMRSNTLRAIPVSELRSLDGTPRSYQGQRLRVAGYVVGPVVKLPVQTDAGTLTESNFQVSDKTAIVTVAYRDALPDAFRTGGPVQVDGLYSAPGKMVAEHVFTKCPSRYDSSDYKKTRMAASRPR